jgi:uncharacterized membrane protein YgdD (TMEM256/DUF423 family)
VHFIQDTTLAMAKLFITLASISGMLAVFLGAFGAHALKDRLDQYSLGVFETAVQYHFYHSFALLAVGVIALSQPQTVMLKSSGWLFLIGIFVFSGSLYLLSITGVRWLGAITPLGGLAFIGGWACLAATGWKLLV